MAPSKVADFFALLWLVTQATQCDSEKENAIGNGKSKHPVKKGFGNFIGNSDRELLGKRKTHH